MREFLLSRKWLAIHNGVRFDVRLIEKILGIKLTCKIYDTLAMSWYMNHDRTLHGLESYGPEAGVLKPPITDWSDQPIETYIHRCVEDVKINWWLWEDLLKKFRMLYKDRNEMDRFLQYLTFKMRCAAEQEAVGWKLDKDLCIQSINTLELQEKEKYEELVAVMPPRQLFKKANPPKNMLKKDGSFSALAEKWFSVLDDLGLDRSHNEEVKVLSGTEPANPGSSDQVKEWLFSLGWQPCTFDYKKNDAGVERAIPQVRKDGELTESVKVLIEDNPTVGVLDGLTVIQHRLSIFKSFLEEEVEGYVHATIAGFTNTLRFKHSRPLVNLPGVDKPWGKEIRGCLIAPDGYVLCGADMVSLESTTKRHYMYPHDPDYVAEMSQPGFDEHLDLAVFANAVTPEQVTLYVENKDKEDLGANLATVIKQIAGVRKKFKPVNYSSVYGVGKVKMSRTTGMSEAESAELIKAYWERNWAVKKVAEEQTIRKIGGKMWLFNPVSGFWISLRYEKDIFSSLNQSTGVFCFDTWLATCWAWGIRGIGQFHDEVITLVKDGEQDYTYDTMKQAIQAVNERLQLHVPLDVSPQFGLRYADIH